VYGGRRNAELWCAGGHCAGEPSVVRTATLALFSVSILSKKRFRNRLLDVLRLRLPQARIQGCGDLSIAIAELGTPERVGANLENAYREFEENPSAIDDIITRWADVIVESSSKSNAGIDVSAVVPVIRSRTWLADLQVHAESPLGRHDLWTEAYNDDLIIAYVEIRQFGFHFVQQREIEASSRPPEDVRSAAFANLRVLSHERTTAADDGLYLIAACGGLGASLLLDETLWSSDALSVRGNFLIGVPARDDLVVTGTDDPFDVFRIADFVNNLYRAEQYPISARLYVWRASRFVPLETGALDPDHPIPDLDTLDLHVERCDGGDTLSIIIAAPMQADARSVYRLFRKLDVYLRYLGSSEFESRHGPPVPDKTEIAVHLHRMSDYRLVRLLNSRIAWAADRGAKLSVIQALH
jgi:uncharacterized protein YtpQ (UPF0354 family)